MRIHLAILFYYPSEVSCYILYNWILSKIYNAFWIFTIF